MNSAKWLDEHFEETLLVALLILIACVELVQVIIRNVSFIPALTWAEEFCRVCWIASVFISLPYTVRKASMLRVSVVLDMFSSKIKNTINIIVDIVTAATMLLLGYYSISVIQRIIRSNETFPAMKWPMWTIYSVMVVSLFLAALRCLQMAYIHSKSFNQIALSAAEQTMEEAKEEAEAGKRAEGSEE